MFTKNKTKRNKIHRYKKQRKITSFKYKGFHIAVVNTGYFYPLNYEWILNPLTTGMKFKLNMIGFSTPISDISSIDSINYCKRYAKYYIEGIKTKCKSNIYFHKWCCD